MKTVKIPIRAIIALTFCLCISRGGRAQNVGINSSTTAANSSAILDLNTGNSFASPHGEGLLIPNVALSGSTDATTISNPAYSLLVYNLGTAGLSPEGYYYNSGTPASPVWTQLIASGAIPNAWSITGNAGTTPVTNFLGTTNGNALEFEVSTQKAGWLDYTSPYNTFFGYKAGSAITSGTLNIAFGFQALASNTIMNGNMAIGDSAMYTQNYSANAVPGGNIAIGNSTLFFNNPTAKMFYTASASIAIGEYALYHNTTIVDNIAIGALSLYSQNTNGVYPGGSTAIGYQVLYSASSSNALETGIGCQALYSYAGSGQECVATGCQALYNDITGGSTAAGYQSLYSNTIGDYNTATGYQALYKNTSGPYNTATGYQALYSNINSIDNVAVGANALYANTGSSNTALGFDAGYTGTNGSENLFAGDSAGYNNTTGYYNTYVGYQAGSSISFQGLTNVVCLGYQAGIGATAIASNDIYLGNSSIQHIYAEVPTMVTYSDRRIKDSIKENVPGLAFITKLRPVTYHLNIHRQNKLLGVQDDRDWPGKYDIEKISQSGFIAQQVDSVARACGYNFCGVDKPASPGGLYQLNYTYFVVPLVKAVQELNDSLKLEYKTGEQAINGLRTDYQMLKAQLGTFHDTLQQYQHENAQVNAKDTAEIAALKEMLKSIKQHDSEMPQQTEAITNK